MFESDLLRYLCRELATEENSDRMEELLWAIRTVVRDNQEEARLRLQYIATRYRPSEVFQPGNLKDMSCSNHG